MSRFFCKEQDMKDLTFRQLQDQLYSMKIKEQTRKLAAGCSKYSFEVVDKTDEVSDHIYGKVKLTQFEEIFEEYYSNITSSLELRKVSL